MSLPDLASLRVTSPNESIPDSNLPHAIPPLHDLPDDKYLRTLKIYAKSLPYSIEPESTMMELLDFIILRITQCMEARDFAPGLFQWDSVLGYWITLKYPIPKEKRIALTRLYYALSMVPGTPTQTFPMVVDGFNILTRSKKKLSISDLRLPWKPIYELLSQGLFFSRRQIEYNQSSWFMGCMADNARRFFHPAAINEMLSTFVPVMNGSDLDSLLASQYYLTTFLPLSHPQTYLPMLFKVWESVNSYMYDERMLHFLAKLSELHVDPQESDPAKIERIPDDACSAGENRPHWDVNSELQPGPWPGIHKDVGIYTEQQWEMIMCKVLSSMEISLADGGSLTTGPNSDAQVGFELSLLPKPSWRISSLARIIIYSMVQDGLPVASSNAPTPVFTPLPSSTSTPLLQTTPLSAYLSAPINKGTSKPTYIAGCHALDSVAKLIASMESFFHPTNSGTWTADLSAFVKFLVVYFNQRWHQEESPQCKVPQHLRVTKEMKRELVKCLRTVTLLAMFSEDSSTITNIQSAMKSMAVMEPDLILHPVLERAIPALETLTETHRTLSVIKSLCAVAPALVCRRVYYPGAKYVIPILQLLIPGIDLNDPSKTLYTAAFLSEISQYIMFSNPEDAQNLTTQSEDSSPRPLTPLPSFSLDGNSQTELVSTFSMEAEDDLLQDTFISLPDWISSFIRRVILLLENLPDEGPDGSAGGTTETQVVDAVTRACRQICAHLSDSLYNLVLNIVFDYASTNVRPNAVRAIHQLVECVTNANPERTIDRFFDLCDRNIRYELENGASSVRTTQVSKPLPSDATLHWYLAILRGTVYNDGLVLLKYKDRFLSLLCFLHEKTFSKRGYSWTGKLLSSLLLTWTHTYPLENKFVNPSEWAAPEFQRDHYRSWGKVYKAEEVEITWHVPSREEVQFVLDIFRQLVAPALQKLRDLLKPDTPRDAIWRNDFCRHLSIVRHAFSGIPTLCRDNTPMDDYRKVAEYSDILDEIPEMIPFLDPVQAGFCLVDPQDPRHQYMYELRREFGEFLHAANQSLLSQGQENTVDAVQMLVRSIRTYMTHYADYRDGYYYNEEQYVSEKNIARHDLEQKEWPRSVLVRRARFYHSARLRWNGLERLRGPLQDALIDDIVQWCIWHYSMVRKSAQSLLESVAIRYDGVRRRALPVLYQALSVGAEENQIKGALWTLEGASFGKYVVSEPTLSPEFINRLFMCQDHEKTSIQGVVSILVEECLKSFGEPSYLYLSIDASHLLDTVHSVQQLLPASASPSEKTLTIKCRRNTESSVQRQNEALRKMVEIALNFGESPHTHWKYAITAIRLLRTLIRQDTIPTAQHVTFFFKNMYDHHSSIQYYAGRAIMKTLRNIKHYTYCKSSADLVLGRNSNPLHETNSIKPSHSFIATFLQNYTIPFDINNHAKIPIFYDKNPPGWIALGTSISMYRPPHETQSTFQPWHSSYQEVVNVVRTFAMDREFWSKLSSRYSEETHNTSISLDHVSCVKSIFQILDDEPFETLKPVVLELLKVKLPDEQRAAAEFLAGAVGGSKHWPTDQQKNLWQWLLPHISDVLTQDLKTDTLPIWVSFLESAFYHKDPRRVQPLKDLVFNQFHNLDYNLEMSFDVTKVMSLFRSLYEEMSWKFSPYADWTIEHCWDQLANQHDDVRGMIAEILSHLDKVKWQPRPSLPTTEVFVKECQIANHDVMELHGTFHKERIEGLAQRFGEWHTQRLPGSRASQSTYDRVGVTVCKWLFQSLHSTHALSTYDYILPLVPEFLRFTELNDNEELSKRASSLLVRMCGVIPPRSCVNPMLDTLFHEVQNSSRWKVRLEALPLLQVFYFRLSPYISEVKIVQMLEVVCQCLDDEIVEVREMAASTLSGILRLSPRRSILTLKDRFVRLAKATQVPKRAHPTYNRNVRQRHAAALGICALIDSYPYTIEHWMPQLLTETLVEMTYDPIPISTTVRKCAGNFKKTHQDTWEEDSNKFDEEQLSALSTLLTGSSYYA